MVSVGIYARYSSDLQKPTSIEDQVRLAKEYAQKQGWTVGDIYADYELSGAFMNTRPGIKNLMMDAAAGKFDIVLTEALDRLSRDQEDIAGFYKRIQFAGVRIHTLAEGDISELHIGLKGTMNALFLKDLKIKVKRGQRGRIEKGFSGGGKCFGYDVVHRFDEYGVPVRGERSINEAQAAIVRRIFEEYVQGRSPKAIASTLNAEGVAGPTTTGWTQSTINGNWQRGTGILNNELYVGQLVWNRVSYPKDPSTGRNVTRINPESEWVRASVPELRILDQELWDKAKALQKRIRHSQPEFWQKQRPSTSFRNCCGVVAAAVVWPKYRSATMAAPPRVTRASRIARTCRPSGRRTWSTRCSSSCSGT